MKSLDRVLSIVALAGLCVWAPGPVMAQVAGANQEIYGDEQSMIRTDQGMIGELQHDRDKASMELSAEEASKAKYRLSVEKQIRQIEGLKKAGSAALSGSKAGELQVLESWIRQDDEYRQRQIAYIQTLDQQIANLRKTQMTAVANLGNDINDMRQNQEDQREQVKFNQQMQINQFNELKSEMGAASWGDTPADGTYNSVGGYGMLGGYGYGMGGGRRWLGGGVGGF
ncbi:MAG: hypothetical protein J0H83_05535 [Candidatus Melainabacteria bacterium]|jgi:hypothetical protein|nr:hypothetical protein [Candidatus Melainabacteria bacterium]MBX9673208.1 hypothetical protein [Candidatus Obscuribacterales bacterium]